MLDSGHIWKMNRELLLSEAVFYKLYPCAVESLFYSPQFIKQLFKLCLRFVQMTTWKQRENTALLKLLSWDNLPQKYQYSMLSELNQLQLQELWNNFLSFWDILGRKEAILKSWVHTANVNGGLTFYRYLKINLKLKKKKKLGFWIWDILQCVLKSVLTWKDVRNSHSV